MSNSDIQLVAKYIADNLGSLKGTDIYLNWPDYAPLVILIDAGPRKAVENIVRELTKLPVQLNIRYEASDDSGCSHTLYYLCIEIPI
jgi:hypothetical protein